jgi:N utilization substance protein B
MLNRRLLRTKAVQAVYSVQLATASNRLIAIDEINEAFAPDLNSMEPQDREKLEGLKKLAIIALDELIIQSEKNESEDVPAESMRVAKNAFVSYSNLNRADEKRILNMILNQSTVLFKEYLNVFALLQSLASLSQKERDRTYQDPETSIAINSGLYSNIYVKSLNANHALQADIIRTGAHWDADEEEQIVKKVYRETLRKDAAYRLYCLRDKHTPAEDQDMFMHVVRKLILKNEIVTAYFEARDLYWEDHDDLMRSMVLKSIKTLDTEGNMQIEAWQEEWEEGKEFVSDLFKYALEANEQFETYLNSRVKNWELERITMMDMVIMKVALAELVNFSGIPVKVSINEYIEIAKKYSTPKSGKFINGILDVLSEQLIEEGVIRKSGRGLIDNK